jgi:hypothetical protein
MLRRFIVATLACGVLGIATVRVAAAQERQPHTGTTAVGFDVGAFVPKQSELGSSLVLNALYEYYVTPRVSLRTGVGWADPPFKSETSDSLRQIPLRADVNYNWEGGKWHPFVGAGVGAYFVQFKDNGQPFGDSETKFGVNVGGGLEYFTGRTVSVKSEARYHAIQSVRTGQDPSGLALTVGLKKYF